MLKNNNHETDLRNFLAIATGIVGGAIGFFAGGSASGFIGTANGMVYGAYKILQTAEKDGLLKPEQSRKILNETTKQVIADFG